MNSKISVIRHEMVAIGFAKGERMNNWQDDFMAEYRRRELLEQAEQIRLEKVGIQSRVYRAGLFERSMFSFAIWMIATGKQLRKRYEVPVINCDTSPAEGFAH